MFCRLPLLLIFLLSLAVGPVQVSVGCDVPAKERSCGPCCTGPEMPCCASANSSVPVQAPESPAPQSVDGKVLVAPCVLVGILCPAPVVERTAFHKWQAARMPVPPRLDLNCIRLI